MKRTIFFLLAAVMTAGCYVEAAAWGRDAHAAIAYIAECNLTPRAKANVEKCIDGNSIVYYSSWLDYHRKEHKAWDKRRHTCDFDFDTNRPYGRPLKHLNEYIKNLKDYENLTDSARKFNIYALVHVMGDYHCPGHADFKKEGVEDKIRTSRNNVRLLNEKKPIKYHTVWDTPVVTYNHGDWGYIEFARVLDNIPQSEKDAITAGTVEDWLTDSAARSKVIYEWYDCMRDNRGDEFEKLPHVDKKRLNDFGDLACDQIERAGLRLAKVLNDLFDK